jgi:hypothetical protein
MSAEASPLACSLTLVGVQIDLQTGQAVWSAMLGVAPTVTLAASFTTHIADEVRASLLTLAQPTQRELLALVPRPRRGGRPRKTPAAVDGGG